MQILKAGALYFSLVYAIGFVLGTIRILWIVPSVGARIAELIEMPFLFVVTVLAARWVIRRLSFSYTPAGRLSMRFVGLGLLLAAEFVVAFWLQHLTVAEYFARQDPVAKTVYLVLLGVFAVMPLLVVRTLHEERTGLSSLLDPFIARPDVRKRHQITIHAPAGMVLEAAREFDMQSISMVRAIFWLRNKVLGAKMQAAKRPAGLIAEMLGIGWGRLAEDPNRFFVAGAVCRPWQADVVFSPVPPEQFAAFAEPGRVKIAWTLRNRDARARVDSPRHRDSRRSYR